MTTHPLENTKVFKPLKVGNVELNHRIFFAPSTRYRGTEEHVPTDLEFQYYDDRSKFPGTLITTEGTFPFPQASGNDYVPGIWSKKQTQGWKKIVEKIHKNKSFASVQLWNLGRTADPAVLKKEGRELLGPSAIYYSDESKEAAEKAGNKLRAFTTAEIKYIIHTGYVKAAENAIEAGFDFVELHCAHGYFFDEFLQPCSNKRTDEYGGSIEKRAKVVLETIDAISAKIGANKVSIRISPWAKFLGMKAEEDEVHPIATFSYLLSELQKRANEGKEIAYVSVVEPRVQGSDTVAEKDQRGDNQFVYQVWKGIIARAGNYTYDTPDFHQVINDVDNDRTIIGFARYFTSNPDLIHRLQKGLELTKYDREHFYNHENLGYNTWGAHGEEPISADSEESKKIPVALV